MKKTQHFCGNDQFLGVLRSLILREGIEFAILYSAKKRYLGYQRTGTTNFHREGLHQIYRKISRDFTCIAYKTGIIIVAK